MYKIQNFEELANIEISEFQRDIAFASFFLLTFISFGRTIIGVGRTMTCGKKTRKTRDSKQRVCSKFREACQIPKERQQRIYASTVTTETKTDTAQGRQHNTTNNTQQHNTPQGTIVHNVCCVDMYICNSFTLGVLTYLSRVHGITTPTGGELRR